MRIATITEFQMTDLIGEYIPIYSNFRKVRGPGFGSLKGDNTAKAAEAQQAAFNQQLMQLFQTQFGKQNAITDQLTKTLLPQLTNPTGFSPDAEAALRSQASTSAADAYANASKAYQASSFSRGSRDLPSGVDSQIQGAISGAGAGQLAGAQQNITLANENLKQQNYWNAINGLNGVSAQLNPLGYANAATSGGNTVANLGNTVNASQQSGVLGGILGGVFGAGSALLGNPAIFGGGKKGCWIAEAVWGIDHFKTHTVRRYLNTEFMDTLFGRVVMEAYFRFGKTVAAWVRKSSTLRWMVTPVFEYAYTKATEAN